MTSTARPCRAAAGYTLIELVITLMIIGIVLAGAFGVARLSSDEYAVKKATRELEALAKRARMTSVLNQMPYALVFREGRVDMMSWAAALQEEGLLSIEEEGEDGGAVRWELTLDNGMQAMVRRWNSSEWLPVRGKSAHAWRFDPSGLCEPLGVRLELNGKTAEMEFHPLTGAITEVIFEKE